MTIPFIDIFKNVKARLFPGTGNSIPAGPPVVRAEKSMADKLSKTVLPSRARERMPMTIEAPMGPSAAPVLAPRAISLDPSRKTPRPSIKGTSAEMDTQAERTISLQLSDVIDQLPSESTKPHDSFDAKRVIVLKASEVEKGMASGKPSVSLASIFQQAPEIFVNSVTPDDATPVLLPFDKVLEQFGNLRVRPDQVAEQAVPQLETPILAVTLEDTQRFGTTMKPLEASTVPPVKVETATAETLSAAEPEPAVREVTRSAKPKPLRPVISLRDIDALAPASVAAGASVAKSETQPQPPQPPTISSPKIPFHLPPNGTGESASERVPASSGPPVPIVPAQPASTPEAASAPTVSASKPAEPVPGKSLEETTQPAKASTAAPRTPFKFKSPSDDIRPKFTLVPGVEPKEKATPTIKLSSKTDETRIRLPLQPLLQEVPAFQLNGSPMSVGDNVFVEFPFSVIEPQLASGRVMIRATAFHRAIPEAHRGLFIVDPSDTPVTLPLSEILKHIPSNALRMRPDQEAAVEVKQEITTPFSIQAEEDAKRFNAMAAATEKASAPVKLGLEKKPALEGPPTVAEAIEMKAEAAEKSTQPDTKVAKPADSKEVSEQAGESGTQKKEDTGSRSTVADASESSKAAPEARTQNAAGAEKAVDPRQVVAQASALPGVGACAISFADGLNLAGNIPLELKAEGICAMTPGLWQRIDTHMRDTRLGAFRSMTLHCADSSLTFFVDGSICLAAVHAGGSDLSDATQVELETIVQKLSKAYAQPESAYTGHHGKD